MSLLKHLAAIAGITNIFEMESKACKHFALLRDKAKITYREARKYPRKKKKAVRKQAILDYEFYNYLSRPLF